MLPPALKVPADVYRQPEDPNTVLGSSAGLTPVGFQNEQGVHFSSLIPDNCLLDVTLHCIHFSFKCNPWALITLQSRPPAHPISFDMESIEPIMIFLFSNTSYENCSECYRAGKDYNENQIQNNNWGKKMYKNDRFKSQNWSLNCPFALLELHWNEWLLNGNTWQIICKCSFTNRVFFPLLTHLYVSTSATCYLVSWKKLINSRVHPLCGFEISDMLSKGNRWLILKQ